VDAGVVTWRDRVLGPQQQDVTVDVGDVVIKRADGLWAYQLAVVVDDLEMGVTDVVRAADLTSSTARQLQLARALGGVPPAFAHVPLMNAPDGTRLQKREPRHTLAGLRDAGVAPEAVVGFLAHSVGLHPLGRPCKPQDLVEDFSLGRLHEQTDWSRLP
jgi:glutamyl-tRNA synthetase